MALADPDLRHGAPAALLLHLRAQLGLQVDADHLDLGLLLAQQPLGRLAERARRSGIHEHPCHTYFSTGSPACRQAPMPPDRFATLVKPSFFSPATAFCERLPSQHTISGLSFALMSTSPASMRDRGRFFAPRMWPVPNSPGSRTSTTRASSRLMSCVARAVSTYGPPAPRRRNGHSSIAPETNATTKRRRLSWMNFTGKRSL